MISFLSCNCYKHSEYGYPQLGHVHWLEVYGEIPTSRLSPDTAYEAYLVFDLSDYVCYGFHIPIEASVGIPGEESTKESIYLDPRIANSKCNHHCPNIKPREADSRLEVKLGEYFNKKGENRDVEITLKEVESGRPKCGVVIIGMEMRPKRNIIL